MSAELLDRLLRDEAEATVERFGHDEAWQLGTWAVERMRRDGLVGAVTVFLADQRVFHAGLPGSSADLDLWLDRKVRVVRQYGRSSYYVKQLFLSRGQDFARDSLYDPSQVMAAGGGFPIRIGAATVGIVAFSGWTEEGEHALGVEAVAALGAAQRANPAAA